MTAIKLWKYVKIQVFGKDSNITKLYLQGSLKQIKAGAYMLHYHSFQNMSISLLL